MTTFGRFRTAVVAALAASALFSSAQTQKWPVDGPAFSATPASIEAAAAAIKAEPFMDVTVLFEQERYRFELDGKLTHVHQLLYRIETKDGVDDWNQSSVEWDPWHENQPSIRARVLLADGKVSELDPHTLTDVPAKNEDEDTFSDERIRKGPLPSLAIGAIVEEETILTEKSPFFAAGSVYRAYMSRDVPVVRSRVIVEVPAETPYRSKMHFLPNAVYKTEQADGFRRETFEQENVPLTPASDISLSTDKPLDPYIEFSTGASWAAVASSYRKLAEVQIQPERIKSLLPASLPAERVAAAQALVSKLHHEIRYTGIEFGESGLQPQNPVEVLKRHYGDCKDKAAFLVAMLRASGIPANLALLNTGPGLDVDPASPGMGEFDHAIVHVPAGMSGEPELWIDATADDTRVGDLPYEDQGRLALIIAEGTTDLTMIPPPKPADSVLVETREFTLAPIGPAHVVETSATTGHVDAEYRSRYGVAETKHVREDLDEYAKRVYMAKALTHVDHGTGADFSKPFVLRLEMASATRGNTGVDDAAVAIPPAGILDRLPRWFTTDPDAEDTKPTPQQEEERKKKEQARTSEYLVKPFIHEWRYRIRFPDGFVARTLPEDQTLKMGPATLTRHFAMGQDDGGKGPEQASMVTAVYRFDTGKLVYSLEEALALRKAVLEEEGKDYLLIYADQAGAKLLNEGKIKQALATDRALVAAHPSSSSPSGAMDHVHLSSALLRAGLGDEAQTEARAATTLDPKSSAAFFQLGIALEYNEIGVFLGRGFDRNGAIAALIKAKQLDPEDLSVRTTLATLYEHNAEGDRYAADANLAGAVREYRGLKDVDKATATRFEDSLLYAMLFDREFKELLAELGAQQSNATREAIAITAVAASQDVAAALQRADHAGDAQEKNVALRLSGQQLIRLNLYPQAAQLLTAGIQGQDDAAALSRQIEVFRNLQHAQPKALPASDPRSPVQLMMFAMIANKLQQAVPALLTRHAFPNEKQWDENIKQNDSSGSMVAVARRSQVPMSVMADVLYGNMKFVSTGDDSHGYRVSLQSIGAAPQEFFVTREGDGYKIVASGSDNVEVGNYAAYLQQNNREAEARNLLDWKRALVHRGGGDDPLEGDLFARFWTEGATMGAQENSDTIQIAAIALTIQKPDSQTPLGPALALYGKTPVASRSDLALLLASASLNHGDAVGAKPYIAELLNAYPDSITAISLAGRDDAELKDFVAWRAMLDSRLAKRPADRDLLLQSAVEAESEGDYVRARTQLQLVLDSGKATSNDYNNFGWLALFDSHLGNAIDEDSVKAAQQANLLSKNASFADMHTLACLYAAQGKTAEARQLLLDAMAAGNQSEPNSTVWFGFGSIYEQLGETQAAIAAYRKVMAPKGTIGPIDTYRLAQAGLKRLNAG